MHTQAGKNKCKMKCDQDKHIDIWVYVERNVMGTCKRWCNLGRKWTALCCESRAFSGLFIVSFIMKLNL